MFKAAILLSRAGPFGHFFFYFFFYTLFIHLGNFGRGHYEEHFCKIIVILDQIQGDIV